MKFFKDRLDFFKENRQIGYSIFLLISIPAILIFNTFYLTNSFNSVFNHELRLKAELASSVIKNITIQDLNNEALIQEKIKRIVDESLYGTIKSIEILKSHDNNFIIIASSNLDNKGKIISENNINVNNYAEKNNLIKYKFAWSQSKTLANLNDSSEEQYWSIIDPIVDNNGNKIGLVDISVSSSYIQNKFDKSLSTATLILILSIIIVFLLIINNAKMFQYVVLFRKLKEVDKMKDEFVSIASHELRTPITVIKGFLEILTKNGDKINKKKVINTLVKSANRLEDLVADLLDVSRIEQGRMKFNYKATDVAPLVVSLKKEYDYLAKKKSLKLIFINKMKDSYQIKIDQDKFKQVIINLIGNAIKYTKKGYVEIFLENNNKYLIIKVKDSGIGMNEEDRKKLFTKFYRIRNKETEDISGTGLGLWITKEIISHMNGKISVDSIPGVGSQFTIEFPIIKK